MLRSPSPITPPSPDFNPTKIQCRRLRRHRQGRRNEVHRHHREASRRFRHVRIQANPFNIVDATPFRRDPLRELAGEARKQGIKLTILSSWDNTPSACADIMG